MSTDEMEWFGLLVDYCDVFFTSCLDSHSDGSHSLQMIDVMIDYSW